MRRDHLKMLRGVAEVRDLQRMRAEADVGRRAVEVEDLKRQSKAQTDQLCLEQKGWEDGLARRSIDLLEINAWADAVLRAQSVLERTFEDIGYAKTSETIARQAWSRAIALSDAAGDLVRTAHRDLVRGLEEEAMDEAAERADQFGGRS